MDLRHPRAQVQVGPNWSYYGCISRDSVRPAVGWRWGTGSRKLTSMPSLVQWLLLSKSHHGEGPDRGTLADVAKPAPQSNKPELSQSL